MKLDALLNSLTRILSTSGGSAAATHVPEWEGWVVLGALSIGFGLLVWWLYFSPLPERDVPADLRRTSLRSRQTLAALVLLSGCLFVVGARWDELWHRIYGGFGDDFLWPPHLMIYGSLGLNSFFAAFGLVMAGRGPGGVRDRFRANPLVGLLGLLSVYQLASIPSDLLWHEIIGPDISAWSLPHALLMVSSSAVLLIGLALALSSRPRCSWRTADRPGFVEFVALALLTASTLALLQFGVTEWEWTSTLDTGMPFGRPVWLYPVVVLAIGAAEAHLALYGLRRVGAATVVALSALSLQLVFVAFAHAALPPGPAPASYLLLVGPAIALDLWYAWRTTRAGAWFALVLGTALYSAVFFVEVVSSIENLIPYPPLSVVDVVDAVAVGLPAALAVSVGARSLATWLNVVGASRGVGRWLESGGAPERLTVRG